MWRYLLRRLGLIVLTVFAASLIIFAITQLLPGDVARLIVGQFATEQAVENVRVELGLDKPIYVQYASWLSGFVTGDWGTSLINKVPVRPLVFDRLWNSAWLAFVAFFFYVPLGIFFGVLAALRRVQNDLFDLGADLATPDRGTKLEWTPLRIVEAQVKRLETEIDAMNVNIAPLDSFILPGGSALAAHMHVARTLCRRAERQIAELFAMEDEVVSPEALAYANRLSDWLFVIGRVANNDGKDDIKWVPGANR